jgi:hypothetical protein
MHVIQRYGSEKGISYKGLEESKTVYRVLDRLPDKE